MNYPGKARPTDVVRAEAPMYHKELFVSDPEGRGIKPFLLVRESGMRRRIKFIL